MLRAKRQRRSKITSMRSKINETEYKCLYATKVFSFFHIIYFTIYILIVFETKNLMTKFGCEVSNRMLSNSERENKFRANNQKLGSQTLEKSTKSFIFYKIFHNRNTTLW